LYPPCRVAAKVAGLSPIVAERRPVEFDPPKIINFRQTEVLRGKRIWVLLTEHRFLVIHKDVVATSGYAHVGDMIDIAVVEAPSNHGRLRQ
jgi:hypothetical protein